LKGGDIACDIVVDVVDVAVAIKVCLLQKQCLGVLVEELLVLLL